MKSTLILIILFWTLSVAGQIEPLNKKDAKASLKSSTKSKDFAIDTIPIVEYKKAGNVGLQPVYYINRKIANPTVIKTIDPQLIDSIHVEKKEILIKDKKYYGQIFFKMKKEYHPKLISLTDLRSKYLSQTNNPTIFMIDGDIIKGDYESYLVDEKYVLKIIVDHMEDKEQKLNVEIVQLLTKSDENIEKAKDIRIRGLNEITIN